MDGHPSSDRTATAAMSASCSMLTLAEQVRVIGDVLARSARTFAEWVSDHAAKFGRMPV
jgi:hypothetical protein